MFSAPLNQPFRTDPFELASTSVSTSTQAGTVTLLYLLAGSGVSEGTQLGSLSVLYLLEAEGTAVSSGTAFEGEAHLLAATSESVSTASGHLLDFLYAASHVEGEATALVRMYQQVTHSLIFEIAGYGVSDEAEGVDEDLGETAETGEPSEDVPTDEEFGAPAVVQTTAQLPRVRRRSAARS